MNFIITQEQAQTVANIVAQLILKDVEAMKILNSLQPAPAEANKREEINQEETEAS